MKELLHPHYDQYSLFTAYRAEDVAIGSAYAYFQLAPYSSCRKKEVVSSFQKVHDKFKEIGILTDLDLYARSQSVQYVRLCIARAEMYRQTYMDGVAFSRKVPIKDLPVGPIGCLDLKLDYYLGRIVQEKEINNMCCVCRDTVRPHETVLFACKCCAVSCVSCCRHYISTEWDTYKGHPAAIRCPICRERTDFCVTNTSEAGKEETRLVNQANARIHEENKKQHLDFIGKKPPKLANDHLKKLHAALTIEASDWVKGTTDGHTVSEIMTKGDNSMLKCEIARLQVQRQLDTSIATILSFISFIFIFSFLIHFPTHF